MALLEVTIIMKCGFNIVVPPFVISPLPFFVSLTRCTVWPLVLGHLSLHTEQYSPIGNSLLVLIPLLWSGLYNMLGIDILVNSEAFMSHLVSKVCRT